MRRKTVTSIDTGVRSLIATASQTLNTHFTPGRHHVACALRTKNGKVYRGLQLDCAGFDTCAEPTAIASACLAGDTELTLIVAVQYDRSGKPTVVNPCGNCVQHLLVFAPHGKVIVQTPAGLQCLSPASLLPYPYA